MSPQEHCHDVVRRIIRTLMHDSQHFLCGCWQRNPCVPLQVEVVASGGGRLAVGDGRNAARGRIVTIGANDAMDMPQPPRTGIPPETCGLQPDTAVGGTRGIEGGDRSFGNRVSRGGIG